ncbi:hypothetical protein C7H84_09565 [Burkholderia sp. Nafp2/4-1b]|uniref:hypothetical protein n=1 Tax=Burkholderia sp. Nafp2/4-1b TaxID=2116686 RepID=UPI000EF89B8F|nr:hypothetical protein [Burkholderia sp. Nafp2/4-1b]RKU03376.1 hypothetical protein C7H84_09565 [Burkholderia sp. Nafp2/4-1b]
MNWQILIRDLLDARWTQRSIADVIGVTQGRVAQVLHARPDYPMGFRYETGRKLVNLHRRVCRRPPPKRREPLD